MSRKAPEREKKVSVSRVFHPENWALATAIGSSLIEPPQPKAQETARVGVPRRRAGGQWFGLCSLPATPRTGRTAATSDHPTVNIAAQMTPRTAETPRLFRGTPVRLSGSIRPHLSVVVDTEEEFDWDAPFSRSHTSVEAMRQLGRAQRLFDQLRVCPTYVIDYPVATQAPGFEQLREWVSQKRCTVGAHLHPWVTPPFDEEVNNRNSFTCNLPPSLQDRKIRELAAAIEAHLDVKPRTFKAGRYGIGEATVATLEALDFEVDASVNPHMDFRPLEGPDFTGFDSRPFWLGSVARMLEVPCTQGYVGWARAAGDPLRRVAERGVLKALRAPGILARAGAVNRVMLSPEGNSLAEMRALTRTLLGDGLRVFSLTFHSPSVAPGHTPYVRSQADLDAFLTRIEKYLEFFFDEVGGVASSPEDVRRLFLAAH
jgi:hypothetical protein